MDRLEDFMISMERAFEGYGLPTAEELEGLSDDPAIKDSPETYEELKDIWEEVSYYGTNSLNDFFDILLLKERFDRIR